MNPFWLDCIWLPSNISWTYIEKIEGFPKSFDLIYAFPVAIFILILRYILQKFCFTFIGKKLAIKINKPIKPNANPLLEILYSVSSDWNKKQMYALAKHLDVSEHQISKWFRIKKDQTKPTSLDKFCELAWRTLYYFFIFFFGMYVLWNKPWLWDLNECWKSYPNMPMTNDVWWYYITSLGFYWSLSVSQFFDVKRNDFWQMFLHHILTIIVMHITFITNFVRYATLVMLLHDSADIFVESAKLVKAAGYQKLCDILFVMFTLVWIVTRLVIFPFWILHNITHEATVFVPLFPMAQITVLSLQGLFILHILWTYMILKVVYKSILAGELKKDIRSDTENSSEESDKR